MAITGAIATARIQGADVEVPTLAGAREHFHNWLLGEDDSGSTDDTVIMRALGLGKG